MINVPKYLEEAKRLSEITLIPGNTYNQDVLDKIALAKCLLLVMGEARTMHKALKDIESKKCHTDIFPAQTPYQCHDDACGCTEVMADNTIKSLTVNYE